MRDDDNSLSLVTTSDLVDELLRRHDDLFLVRGGVTRTFKDGREEINHDFTTRNGTGGPFLFNAVMDILRKVVEDD